jgi:hypothetical protein
VFVVLSNGTMAAGQQEHYLRSVAAGVEDHYLGAGEAPGRWFDEGAARLDLARQVGCRRSHAGRAAAAARPTPSSRVKVSHSAAR